ncbi:sulfite exporter TauE/SafE family protein [Candidatus Micrarchaeota archaeon]|nr:sulfite exporter TauE/SafE family protein [Candidatus Micrarchaeota archaeon]
MFFWDFFMLEFAMLALTLGIKHSFDADHLIAVSNLLGKASSLRKSVSMSISWAAGHMLTASLITFVLFSNQNSLLPLILDKFEILVGAMLIFLGALTIYHAKFTKIHSHIHTHGGKKHVHMHSHAIANKADHSHSHMLGIGIIHGLASNDELLLLLTVSLGASSLLEMLAGVGIFSLGVVLGMVAYSILLTQTIISIRGIQIHRAIHATIGAISIFYGGVLLFA